jgi:hypothetical protein
MIKTTDPEFNLCVREYTNFILYVLINLKQLRTLLIPCEFLHDAARNEEGESHYITYKGITLKLRNRGLPTPLQER